MKHNTFCKNISCQMSSLLVFMIPLLVGCSTTYKTKHLVEHVVELTKVFDDPYVEIQKDFKFKSLMVENLKEGGANFKIFPFNRLDEQLLQLERINNQLLESKSTIEKFYFSFRELEIDYKEISPKDEKFPLVQEYKEFAKNFESFTEAHIKDYVIVSQEFRSLTQKSDIYYLYPQKFNQQLIAVGHRLKRTLNSKSKKVERVKRLISDSNHKDRERKFKLLSEMTNLLARLKDESKVIDRVSHEVQLSFSHSQKIVVGPHLDSHNYLVNLRQKNKEIKELLSRLDQVDEQL